MKSLSPALLSGPALLLATACLSAGCAGPGYYAQAVSGHLDLMRARRDVAAVLADESTGAELRRDLQAAAEIRAFAVSSLSLPDNGSFTEYVHTGREAVTWNVVAAPEFSLEPRHWCFMFAGCVPYRGYFDPLDAEHLAARLAGKGNDVAVSPALAYSTLGWFRDPLLDTMFRYSEEQLAGIVFHELAHQKLYVQGDAAFNESYATFIEEIGVMLWLEGSGRAERLPEWRRRRQATAEFAALVDETRRELAGVYASTGAPPQKRVEKAAVFASLEERYRASVQAHWQGADYFSSWFNIPPNNARLALFESYRGGTCAFAALYEAAGKDLADFQALAAEQAALGKAARRAWLEQPCAVIAPRPDL
jgi:predicted aminopeptidase